MSKTLVERRPLNGTKTNPLKPVSIEVLRRLVDHPIESYRINPGVRDRLSREGLAEEYWGIHKGREGRYYRITEEGRNRLSALGQSE